MTVDYIREIYGDPYNTLRQSIVIDCKRDALSNGNHSRCLRQNINPNLHLIRVEHIDNNGLVIYAQNLKQKNYI